jgi:parallel beta-helix repeat protein
VRGNDFRFNVGGIELDHSNRNRIESNDARHSGGIGIEVSDSFGNLVVLNDASHSGARGIVVTGAAGEGDGNVLERNAANDNNGSGIVLAAGGHTLTGNTANRNSGWGIHAAAGTIDGGGNVAVDNAEARQCFGIACSDGSPPPEPPECPTATVRADADAWIDQSSPGSNKGRDSILKVRSQGPSGNFRALVHFELPNIPDGCELSSAALRLYAAADSTYGARVLEAYRVTSEWTELGVAWANQPATAGPAAAAPSGTGYRQWAVTAQVAAMYDGANHGFLIRDANENQTGEQQFHSREKGSQPPELVLEFIAAGD